MARLQDAAAAAGEAMPAGGGGGAMAPQLADAAAQAGAPGPQQQPQVGAQAGAGAPPPDAGGMPPGGAPAPGGMPPGGMPPGAAPGGAAPPPPGQPAGATGGPAGAVEPYLQQATPEEQQEYARAMRALAKVLYGSDKIANSIVDQVRPEHKVSDTAKVTMMFIKELDRKINMDQNVIAEVTRESVERISELAEARHGIQYSMQDMEQVMGATWEGVQSIYGNEDVASYTQTVQGMRPEDLETLRNQQETILSQGRS